MFLRWTRNWDFCLVFPCIGENKRCHPRQQNEKFVCFYFDGFLCCQINEELFLTLFRGIVEVVVFFPYNFTFVYVSQCVYFYLLISINLILDWQKSYYMSFSTLFMNHPKFWFKHRLLKYFLFCPVYSKIDSARRSVVRITASADECIESRDGAWEPDAFLSQTKISVV